MDNIQWIWIGFTNLTWWQMILWGGYFIYFLYRSMTIWDEVNRYGIAKGYRRVIISGDTHVRLYHLVRIIIDLPPIIVGVFFPLLKKIFNLKLYEFKVDEKN